MNSEDEVKAAVQERVSEGDFVARLAERVGAAARASAVFGEPVAHAGLTVIPVARATWGFGGGSGEKAAERGLGGGGGTAVVPIGYIEVRDTGAEFKPIRSPRVLVAAGAAAAGLSALAVRAIRG